MRVSDGELAVRPQDGTVELHSFTGEHRLQNREVLAHVPARHVERETEHALDNELVRQPDTKS